MRRGHVRELFNSKSELEALIPWLAEPVPRRNISDVVSVNPAFDQAVFVISHVAHRSDPGVLSCLKAREHHGRAFELLFEHAKIPWPGNHRVGERHPMTLNRHLEQSSCGRREPMHLPMNRKGSTFPARHQSSDGLLAVVGKGQLDPAACVATGGCGAWAGAVTSRFPRAKPKR